MITDHKAREAKFEYGGLDSSDLFHAFEEDEEDYIDDDSFIVNDESEDITYSEEDDYHNDGGDDFADYYGHSSKRKRALRKKSKRRRRRSRASRDTTHSFQCPVCSETGDYFGTNRFEQMVTHAEGRHDLSGDAFELPCERCQQAMGLFKLTEHRYAPLDALTFLTKLFYRKECRAGGRVPCDQCGKTFSHHFPLMLRVHKFKEHLISTYVLGFLKLCGTY